MTPYLRLGLVISNLQQSQRLLDKAIESEPSEKDKQEMKDDIKTLDAMIVRIDHVRDKYRNEPQYSNNGGV